jgi:hypothetical protein
MLSCSAGIIMKASENTSIKEGAYLQTFHTNIDKYEKYDEGAKATILKRKLFAVAVGCGREELKQVVKAATFVVCVGRRLIPSSIGIGTAPGLRSWQMKSQQ